MLWNATRLGRFAAEARAQADENGTTQDHRPSDCGLPGMSDQTEDGPKGATGSAPRFRAGPWKPTLRASRASRIGLSTKTSIPLASSTVARHAAPQSVDSTCGMYLRRCR